METGTWTRLMSDLVEKGRLAAGKGAYDNAIACACVPASSLAPKAA